MNSPWKKMKLLTGFLTFERDWVFDLDAGCFIAEAGLELIRSVEVSSGFALLLITFGFVCGYFCG
jgi:hypothetical protein